MRMYDLLIVCAWIVFMYTMLNVFCIIYNTIALTVDAKTMWCYVPDPKKHSRIFIWTVYFLMMIVSPAGAICDWMIHKIDSKGERTTDWATNRLIRRQKEFYIVFRARTGFVVKHAEVDQVFRKFVYVKTDDGYTCYRWLNSRRLCVTEAEALYLCNEMNKMLLDYKNEREGVVHETGDNQR